MKEKKTLRDQYLNRRLALSKAETSHRSLQIQKRLIDSELFKHCSVIALYSSIRNEVETELLFQESVRQQKTVVYPKTDLENRRIMFRPVKSLDSLSPGAYGILEPPRNGFFDENRIDLAVIPCVAVDRSGNRLGYGAGYYDQWLKGKRVFRLGLAYAFQLSDTLPIAPDDVPLDAIVTEDEWVTIKDSSKSLKGDKKWI